MTRSPWVGAGSLAAVLVGSGLLLGQSSPRPVARPARSGSAAWAISAPVLGATTPAAPAAPAAPAVNVVARAILDRAGVIRQVAPSVGGHPTIALTFDDGPDPQWTPQVLSVLRAAGVKATFCLVGVRAAAHPDLVRAIAADGHTLCDHTVHHDEHLDRRSPAVVNAEIAGAASTLTAIAGRPPTLYRPPGGTLSRPIIDTAHRLQLQVLDWDDDPKDWKGPTAPVIEGTIMNELKPGAIVLLHDGGGDRSATVAQLADLIGRLEGAGYAFAVPG